MLPTLPISSGFASAPSAPDAQLEHRTFGLSICGRPVARPAPSSTSIGQHRADISLSNGRTVHLGIAVKPPHRLASADAAHVVLDRAVSRGETVVVPRTTVGVKEDGKKLALVREGVSLQQLVDGLNALGIGPRDMIAILQAIKAAGAIQADIEVM